MSNECSSCATHIPSQWAHRQAVASYVPQDEKATQSPLSVTHKASQFPSREFRKQQAKREVVPNPVPYLSDARCYLVPSDLRPESEGSTQVQIPIYVSRDCTYSCSHCASTFDNERDVREHLLAEHVRFPCVFEVLDWIEATKQDDVRIIPEWLFLDRKGRKSWRRELFRKAKLLQEIAATHHRMHEMSCNEELRRLAQPRTPSRHRPYYFGQSEESWD